MLDGLQHCFSCVCGQDPAHTWSPGGVLLPICQRCTGLYLGAFVAACLHWLIRPTPTSRWLWLNGGFLLFMVPFGFHWVPQGPGLRTITGVLFGFGLVGFLMLTLRNGSEAKTLPGRVRGEKRVECPTRRVVLWLSLAGATCLVPWLGARGNQLVADTLTFLATGGAVVLMGLLLANVALALRWMLDGVFSRAVRTAA